MTPSPERHATDVIDLHVGFLALSDCAPLIVAQALGLDLRHGIRLHLSRENSWAALRDKLVQGRLDAAHCLYGLVYGVQLGIGGPRHPMQVLMTLSRNGQSITLARRLFEQGIDSGAALALRVQRGGVPLSFAHTYPTGTHAMWLYYWLASHGIDPLRDVHMSTVPPIQMVQRLEDGSIDGCCVGEPWGAVAVTQGCGVTVATSQQVWPGHPEKVLACSKRFTEERPDAARALIMAVLEACRHLDTPGGRSAAARMLAAPEVVGVPLAVLLPRFLGDYEDGMGHRWHDTQGLSFFDQGRVNPPRLSDGLWFMSQLSRWGLLAATPDYEAVAAAVQARQLYEDARTALGMPAIALPATAPVLCDGRVWPGHATEEYIRSFAIHA